MNIQEFIEKENITLQSVKWVSLNPLMTGSLSMDNWRVVIKSPYARIMVHFSMGKAFNGREPELEDVLDCLASDASCLDSCDDIADFIIDFGYTGNAQAIRDAKKTWKAIQRIAKRLQRLLTPEAYQTLLYEVERL